MAYKLYSYLWDGPAGVKDEGTLDFVVNKAAMANNVYKEAAILLYEINTKHPFWGGNKRTAFEAAKIFLLSNGITLKAGFESVVNFVNDMAQGKITYQETITWIKKHTVK